MSDGIKTTREVLEEAFANLIRADINPPSTWQLVKRFFTGKLDRLRIAVIAGTPVPIVRNEDGSVSVAEVPLVIRVTSRLRDLQNGQHAEIVAQIAGDIAEAEIIVTRLNAMEVENFKALYAEPDGETDSRIEDLNQVTEITTRIGIVPSESAATVEA